ncbi:MAG: hypothetical protein PQJ46_10400 [Spirochaetales bacterium]|nr:hypothetical protein [Spirochaetales bacterium]
MRKANFIKKIVILSFVIQILPTSLMAENYTISNYINRNKVKIEAVISFQSKNLILLSYGDLGNKYDYKALLIVSSKDGDVFSCFKCYYRGGLNSNIYKSNDNIGIELHTKNSSIMKTIVVYSIIENKFYSYKTETPVIGQFLIDDNLIYFSSEKNFPSVNYINRKDSVIKRFDNFFLFDPSFIRTEDCVYVFDYDWDPSSYKITKNELLKENIKFANVTRNEHLLDFRPQEGCLVKDVIK